MVAEALEKYGLENEDPNVFCLVQVPGVDSNPINFIFKRFLAMIQRLPQRNGFNSQLGY